VKRARKKASSKDDSQISETIEIIDARPEDGGTYRCAPTPDTLGGKQLTLWVDVMEGAAMNRLSARNTPQKQSDFVDSRPSRSGCAAIVPRAQSIAVGSMILALIVTFKK